MKWWERLLCGLGLHQWGRWSRTLTSEGYQDRICERCNRIRMRDPKSYKVFYY